MLSGIYYSIYSAVISKNWGVIKLTAIEYIFYIDVLYNLWKNLGFESAGIK